MGNEIWEQMARSGYGITNTDTSGAYKYYGYVATFGNWYIMREDTATGTYLYAKGNSITTYTPNWLVTGKISPTGIGLTYSYYNL